METLSDGVGQYVAYVPPGCIAVRFVEPTARELVTLLRDNQPPGSYYSAGTFRNRDECRGRLNVIVNAGLQTGDDEPFKAEISGSCREPPVRLVVYRRHEPV